jgi:hypothetical protein
MILQTLEFGEKTTLFRKLNGVVVLRGKVPLPLKIQ